ncbi:hypothetical protein GHT06_020338 [Daphnia sinensis]|uniref:Alpha-1,4-N-acetylglucosaminyltransferase n=1 Tax=Daphnia sinensis TaxID=1820382 RepID=A0AAD5L2X8_9CRUS|nr:hypothetical protein GHT06_020338 [Daphnia sinensis]
MVCYHQLHYAGFADGPCTPTPTFPLRTDRRNATYIFQWQPQPWELVNNQRIFMHGVTDSADLNAKQSCAAESCAIHNCNRTIQIFMRMPPSYNQPKHVMELNNLKNNSSLYSVFRHYPNVEIIFFKESEYFRNTALFGWYNKGEWRNSPHRDSHLSGFSSIVSLFRGGGLFIDLDTVITLKPLNALKWRNFFIKNEEASRAADGVVNIATNEIFHLVYGHRLSDDVILNLGQSVYDPFSPVNKIFAAAFHDSIANICVGENDTNLCQDLQLLNRRDVFLPQFESLIWRPVVVALDKYIATNKSKQMGKALQLMIKNTVDDNIASLIKWKSYPHLMGQSNLNQEILYSLLLSQHCPHTVKHFSDEFWDS